MPRCVLNPCAIIHQLCFCQEQNAAVRTEIRSENVRARCTIRAETSNSMKNHQHTDAQPRAGRPHMPGYGILDANSGKGLFPWSWATERLTNAGTYWIATVRPDGRPHVMSVWGVWLDDAFYFSSGMQSRKVCNLAGNSQCVITCEVGEDQLIVEGIAEQDSDGEARQKFCDAYQAKYDWDMEGFSEPFFV